MRKYLLIALVVLSGCYSEKKASRQVTRAQAEYPDMVAGNCGAWYPPLESTKEVIKYKQGKPIPGKTNYVTVDCDSAIAVQKERNNNIKKPNKNKGVSDGVFDIPCPPCDSLRVDTLEHLIEQTKINIATIQHQEAEIARLSKDLLIITDSRNDWQRYTYFLGGAWLLYLIWRFIKWKFLKR